jgi:hypothetical protein
LFVSLLSSLWSWWVVVRVNDEKMEEKQASAVGLVGPHEPTHSAIDTKAKSTEKQL